MSDPRTDFFASGAGDAPAAASQDARTAFFASGGQSEAPTSKPVVYDASEFKRRVGRDPEPAELANFKATKGVGWAGDPTQGRFTAGQAAVGAVEDAAALGTGALAAVPAAATYIGSGGNLDAAKKVQGALTYAPRTEAGQAGMQGVGEVMSGPGKVAQFAADKIDPSGNLSATLGDVGERTAVASGILPGVAAVRGGLLTSIGRTAKRVANAVTNSVKDPEASITAQSVAADATRNSPQSMGAAAASPRVSNASPQLQQAIVSAAQRTGGAVNPDAFARHIEADTLPVPIRLTEGEALGDVTRISNERNNAALADFYNKRNGALKQNIQAIRDDVGPDVFSRNSVEHGDTLIKAYQDKAKIADDNIDAKYQALRDANGGKFPVDVKQLASNVEDQLHQQLLYEHAPVQLGQLKSLANKGNMTFEQFEAMRTNLARTMRSSTDGNERAAAGIIRQQMEQLPLSGEKAKINPPELKGIPVLPQSVNEYLTNPESLIKHLTDTIGDSGEALGLRGIYKDELGLRELPKSFDNRQGISPGISRLEGTSTIGLTGDWSYDPEAVAENFKRWSNGASKFGDTDYLAVVKGRPSLDDIANDPGEQVLRDAKTVAYIRRNSNKILDTASLKQLADSARAAARTQFQALDADPAYKAAVQEKVAPDDFVRRFVIGGKRDNLVAMKENLKDDPVAQQTLGVAAIDYLRDAAKVNPDGTGTFTQAGFNKALRGLDPKIRSLLSPEHAETLEQLGNVARYTQEQPAGNFINNSKTFVAAAAEGAKGLAEHAINAKTLGIGGTATRSFLQKRSARAEVKRITAPGAGLDLLDEKP